MDFSYDFYSNAILLTLSAIFFYISITVVSPKICNSVFKTRYTSLSSRSQNTVANDLISGLNGGLAFLAGLWILLRYNVDAVRVLGCVQAGYFIADIILMFSQYGPSGQVLLIAHHFTCLLAFVLVLGSGFAHYLMTLRTINEFSTPFFNARSFLATLGMKKDKIYVINGIIFMLTFFLGRVLLIPAHYYTMLSIPPQDFLRYHYSAQYFMYLVSAFVDVLNVYWFALIFRGFLKYISKRKADDIDQKND